MTGELYARIIIDENERKEIEKAISVMKNVAYAYEKTGLESVSFLIEDLNDGIGVLEEIYY